MALPIQPSFDDLSTPLFDVIFCVLDLETTGGSPKNCEITEIGAVKYHRGIEIGTFQTLVDPGSPIPPSITILTGITHAMVVDAPDISAALPGFLEFIGDAVIVGHNVRFDLSFLNAAAERLGYERLDNDSVDTAALARRLVRPEVRNLKLKTLAAHFRSPVTPNHRAFEDARATAHVLHGLLERVGSMGVTNLDDLLALPRAKGSPFYKKIQMTDSLPRAPGVYMFRDRHDNVIYVGKANNLRQRVRQYFYGDKRRTIGNMMRELATIDHVVCPTPIEAEVTEVRLIHTHRPRHNRRSRPPKSSHFVRITAEDFPRLSLVRTVNPKALAHIGPFRSRRAADRVTQAIWDAIPIRRCRGTPGSRAAQCAPAQLGVAMCPCDGKLDRKKYQEMIDLLLKAIDRNPESLLQPLREKMLRHSQSQRYEEAGWLFDRHNALARALQQRQHWRAMVNAGSFEAADSAGNHVLVDHGLLVSSWRNSTPPLIGDRAQSSTEIQPEVAPSVEQAEEVELIWKWLSKEAAWLEMSTGTLALPTVYPNPLRSGGLKKTA